MPRLIIVLLLVVAAKISAQELYNVRIGTFQDVRADDFAELSELGFVYGLPMDGQLTDVYIGNYTSEDRATDVTENLQNRGFRNAAPFILPVSEKEATDYIQIALRGRGRELNWAELERAGTLYVDARDGVTKVVAGPYANAEAANAALARIRELGYGDAFTRSIKPGRLISVGLFETGIKKPLIPIDLSRAPVRPSGPRDSISPAPPPPAPVPAARPADTVATASPATKLRGEAALAEAVRPVPVTKPSLPEIDVETKRHSAAELQRVLKEKDFYQGSIDGYYGTGTRGAFEKAWNELEELKNYRLLAGMNDPGRSTAGPVSWPEMLVLSVIAGDLAAGLANVDRESELSRERAALFQATGKLSAAESSEARNWESTVWNNLNDWAVEDPLHARLLSALRVAYYQSQVRLEAMYQQRGLSATESRDLATAALRNVLAADLDRFL
ncbi:peptidoglycan-binding domain-containing protein [Lewinella sp. IMCC34191]|uniref:peptidoglycan-binding domain-containing protein n=1 Tax=Lewinella sp. IMCC34191 TaxID=2259172 RepID=UPI000E21C683|nr:SPOR domain-containing protein [Lewinella sp. IMCC34191]